MSASSVGFTSTYPWGHRLIPAWQVDDPIGAKNRVPRVLLGIRNRRVPQQLVPRGSRFSASINQKQKRASIHHSRTSQVQPSGRNFCRIVPSAATAQEGGSIATVQKRRARRTGRKGGRGDSPSDSEKVSVDDILSVFSAMAPPPDKSFSRGFEQKQRGERKGEEETSENGPCASTGEAADVAGDNADVAREDVPRRSKRWRKKGGGDVDAESEPDAREVSEVANAGDPLGKKFLGRSVVKWLHQGAADVAREAVAMEVRANGVWGVESSLEAVERVKEALGRIPCPPGMSDKCHVASEHYPTVWDNLQREIQSALQTAHQDGLLSDWRETATWHRTKQLLRSGAHKSVTRTNPALPPAPPSTSAIQTRIRDYVAKALELLRVERDAEVAAAQVAMDVGNAGRGKGGVEGGVEGENGSVGVGGGEGERSDVMRRLTAVSSSTGLGGTHLVTLRASGGTRLPPSTLSPGDMVCVRVEILRGWGGGGLAPACVRGKVHRLGEDGSSLEVALESRFGDPEFARMVGKRLRVERVSQLADATTYNRNREALERLRKHGLHPKCPARKVVAAVFAPPPTSPAESPEPQPPPPPGIDTPAALELGAEEGAEEGPDGRTGLDFWQRAAVEAALDTRNPVTVIQGPPGTGKTRVLTELICGAVGRGERVVAVAPTNAAVDNLVEKLGERGVKVVRVGNPARVAQAVVEKSLEYQVEVQLAGFRCDLGRRRADLRRDLRAVGSGEGEMQAGIRAMLRLLGKTLKQRERLTVAAIMGSAQVVLCTATGAGDPLLQAQPPFDLVVVDEAGQATEPATWIPLLLGDRAVLAGDTCQLAPTVLSREAAEGGLATSLMERATAVLAAGGGGGRGGVGGSVGVVCPLLVQYRMHRSIAHWASGEMYGGRLESAAQVAGRRLVDDTGVKPCWGTERSMVVLDTRLPRGTLLPGCEEVLDPSGSGSILNEGEAEVVVSHVIALLAAGVGAGEIAVQSPYLAQVGLLQARLGEVAGAEGVEVASVDSFQGREADAVVISMVRSNPLGAVGFLGDKRRMNVAITRARKHVAIVCDSTTVGRNAFLGRLLMHVKREGEGSVRCAEGYLGGGGGGKREVGVGVGATMGVGVGVAVGGQVATSEHV